MGTHKGLFGSPTLEVLYVLVDLVLYSGEVFDFPLKAVLHPAHNNLPPARGYVQPVTAQDIVEAELGS